MIKKNNNKLTEFLQRGDLKHPPVHDPLAPILAILLQVVHLPLNLLELGLHLSHPDRLRLALLH